MTNLITESTTKNIVNELLDDIKENIIQINDNCKNEIFGFYLFKCLFIICLFS